MEQSKTQNTKKEIIIDGEQLRRVLDFFHNMATMRKKATDTEIRSIEKMQSDYCANENNK